MIYIALFSWIKAKDLVDALEDEKTSLKNYVEELDAALLVIEEKIADLESQIEQKEADIVVAQEEIPFSAKPIAQLRPESPPPIIKTCFTCLPPITIRKDRSLLQRRSASRRRSAL